MGGKNASRKSQARKNSFDGACLQFPTPCQNRLKILIFNDKKMLVMMCTKKDNHNSARL